MDDARFALKDVDKLNIYFGNIIGIDITPDDYNMQVFNDGSISILGMRFKSFSEYVKYFDSINNDDTSYVIKKGKEQYTEYYGDVIPKELVIKWFNDNVLPNYK
jgi:hypothetical protein